MCFLNVEFNQAVFSIRKKQTNANKHVVNVAHIIDCLARRGYILVSLGFLLPHSSAQHINTRIFPSR